MTAQQQKLRLTHPIATLTAIWFAWVIILIGFQMVVLVRMAPVFPDRVMKWTESETAAGYQSDRPYLLDPFMNNQVAWDSEFYLSIAIHGYDDPLVRTNQPGSATPSSVDPGWRSIVSAWMSSRTASNTLSLNYAFMPFYPLVIHMVAIPLGVLGMNAIATATLAGVIVSALGALGGMIGLYYLGRDKLGYAGGMRAAFYLIIFPAGFFLAQVYTEGLFVGLAFMSLALLRRRKMVPAAILAAFAAWTRAVGVALVIPMTMEWFREREWIDLDLDWADIFHNGIPWKPIGKMLLCFAPLVAYLLWRMSYLGQAFSIVESTFFGRGFLDFGASFDGWRRGFQLITGSNPQSAAYYLIEWAAILLGFSAGFAYLKREPDIALFSLAVVMLSVLSGPAQGMVRYVMAAPATFLLLARAGKNPVFDRAWTIASLLLMGLLAMLYTYNMWVA